MGAPRPSKNTYKASPVPKFGSGSVSGFKSRDATAKPSSGSLLAKMRARRAMEANDNSAAPGKTICLFYKSLYLWNITDIPSLTVLDDTSQEGMIVKIRDFLSTHNGRGTSQEIMNNLQLNINQEQVVVFRKMLQAIAKFEKDQTGKGVWILKEDFF